MKKLFTLSLCLPLIAFTQTDTAVINKNAADWFKNNYVETYFKNPKSFVLFKITSRPITFYDAIVIDIEGYNKIIQEKELRGGLSKDEKRQVAGMADRKAKLESDLRTIDIEKRQQIKYYAIYLECTGNNNFGAPIFSKMTFKYFPNKPLAGEDIEKIN